MSKSSAPMPQPSAAIIVRISSLPSILSNRAFSTFRILPLSGRMAWNRRSRPCLAEPPADSPSTMYSSLSAGSPSLPVGHLPGQRAPVERALAQHQIAGLPGRLARTGRIDRLPHDPPRHPGVLLEVRAELVVENGLDDALDLGVAELGLGLALELRMRDLHADDGRQPFADVVAGDALLQVFREVILRRIRVDGARQRGPEARKVRPTL